MYEVIVYAYTDCIVDWLLSIVCSILLSIVPPPVLLYLVVYTRVML